MPTTVLSKPASSLVLSAVEALVAVLTPALFLWSCILIRVNPRDRLGQISGIAALELRFFVVGIALLVALLVAARVRDGRGFATTSRLVCAAAAGLASALIAGGILVALRGTPWGLHTPGGDVVRLASWADALVRGGTIPPEYPPLPVHVLATYADLTGLSAEFAIKHLQLVGTAAFGPLAYLCWRLLLSPGQALAISIVAIAPLVDAYKPYPHLVLVAFVPLSLLFLQTLRDLAGSTWLRVIRVGIVLGGAFGVMFLAYSGWFKWSAPGLLVATLVVFPWRTARRAGLIFLCVAAATFLLVCGRFLFGLLLNPDAAIVDRYVYFDVRVEPMYIAMWRNDLPGNVGTWPPLGELGGVGVFSLILLGGLGLAVALGRRTVLVLGLGAMMVGAFLLRFWHARALWETKLVQLYPRTTPFILYCLLVLVCLAVIWAIERRPTESPLRGRTGLIGALCALLLASASVGSSIADQYMPNDTTPPGPGYLAFSAHRAQRMTRHQFHRATVLRWIRRPLPPTN